MNDNKIFQLHNNQMISKIQQLHTQEEEKSIFNESFYHQKLKKEGVDPNVSKFTSIEYVKKYFQKTNIHNLIAKAVRNTLQGSFLPRNPYNVIGRLMVHESLFENLKTYYTLNTNQSKFLDQIGSKKKKNSQSVFDKFQSKNKVYLVSSPLKKFISPTKAVALQQAIFKGSYSQRLNNLKNKHGFSSLTYSFGGAVILNVGSPYSCQNYAKVTCYIISEQNQEKTYDAYSQFILDDCSEIKNTPDTLLIKLDIFSQEEQQLIQWAPEQLVQQRRRIANNIRRYCFQDTRKIIVNYITKVTRDIYQQLGQYYILVQKTYILGSTLDSGEQVIHGIDPLSPLMKQVFVDTSYIVFGTKILQLQSSSEEIYENFIAQQFRRMVYLYRTQQLGKFAWSIFYTVVYKQNTKSSFLQTLLYMIHSPVSYLDELIYDLRVAKYLANKSVATEKEIFQIVEKLDRLLLQQEHKSQYVYPETITFFQIFRRLCACILDSPSIRASTVISIFRLMLPIVKSLVDNYYQIILVLQGHLLHYIQQLDKQYGTSQSKEIFHRYITYDNFIRSMKFVPERTLPLFEQIKRYSKELGKSQNEVQDMIVSKYVKTYGLYDHIYNYYWELIIGKKVNYPLTKFLLKVKFLSIQFQYEEQLQDLKQYYAKQKLNVKAQPINIYGLDFFEMVADMKGQSIFYSLSFDSLQFQSLKDYQGYYELFEPFIKPQSLIDQRLKYIISIKAMDSFGRMEQSSSNHVKMYVDIICNSPIREHDIYQILYNSIMDLMDRLDKENFGVIGVFLGKQQNFDEQSVLYWSTQNQATLISDWIKYDYKMRPDFKKVSKIFLNSQRDNVEIQIKMIYSKRDLLKSCTLSYNLYYKNGNNEGFKSFHKTYNNHQKVFYSRNDILAWKQIDDSVKGVKSFSPKKQKQTSSISIEPSQVTTFKLDSGDINFMNLIIEDTENRQLGINLTMIKKYSPFYVRLDHSLNQCMNFVHLIRYLKTDRRGRYQLKSFRKTIEILQYHLLEKCLKTDRYVHSQGISTMIFNLLSTIKQYFNNHPDNNGSENQLLYLQKIVLRLIGCIKFNFIACAVEVAQTIRQGKKKQRQEKQMKNLMK